MTAQATSTPSLMTFYQGWESYQRGLLAMLAPLTPAQLASPIPAHTWTIGLVAQHLIANRVWWFQVWMGEGSPDLAPIAHWDPADNVEQAPLTAPELVAGLEATWQLVADCLNRWTAADLDTVFQPPAALNAEERANWPAFSRQWIIWHVFEHEIHHGGELSVALGCLGLPGIYGTM